MNKANEKVASIGVKTSQETNVLIVDQGQSVDLVVNLDGASREPLTATIEKKKLATLKAHKAFSNNGTAVKLTSGIFAKDQIVEFADMSQAQAQNICDAAKLASNNLSTGFFSKKRLKTFIIGMFMGALIFYLWGLSMYLSARSGAPAAEVPKKVEQTESLENWTP